MYLYFIVYACFFTVSKARQMVYWLHLSCDLKSCMYLWILLPKIETLIYTEYVCHKVAVWNGVVVAHW